jgi:hypothetical protein
MGVLWVVYDFSMRFPCQPPCASRPLDRLFTYIAYHGLSLYLGLDAGDALAALTLGNPGVGTASGTGRDHQQLETVGFVHKRLGLGLVQVWAGIFEHELTQQMRVRLCCSWWGSSLLSQFEFLAELSKHGSVATLSRCTASHQASKNDHVLEGRPLLFFFFFFHMSLICPSALSTALIASAFQTVYLNPRRMGCWLVPESAQIQRLITFIAHLA